MMFTISPGRMLLRHAMRRAQEGTKAGWCSSRTGHRRKTLGCNIGFFGAIMNGIDCSLCAGVGGNGSAFHETLLFGGLHQPHLIEHPRDIHPGCAINALLKRLSHRVRQSCRSRFQTDRFAGTRALEIFNHNISCALGIRMPDESRVSHLVTNRHVLHCPGHEHQFTFSRHNKHVRRKITPMIQSREIEHMFRRAQQDQIKTARRHFLTGGCQASAQFFI